MTKQYIGRHAVVTTQHRGVFAGVVAEASEDGSRVTLRDARMCVYWSVATRGVLGLASGGPREGSRVTCAVPELSLLGVTAVMPTTADAQAAWEAEPWS